MKVVHLIPLFALLVGGLAQAQDLYGQLHRQDVEQERQQVASCEAAKNASYAANAGPTVLAVLAEKFGGAVQDNGPQESSSPGLFARYRSYTITTNSQKWGCAIVFTRIGKKQIPGFIAECETNSEPKQKKAFNHVFSWWPQNSCE